MHELPEELGAVGVDGFDLGAPGRAGGGGVEGVGVGRERSGDGERGRQVLLRHGIDAMAEVGLDQIGHARSGGEDIGGDEGDGLVGERGAYGELAAQALQAGGDVEDPEIAIARRGARDAIGEVLAGIEQQHQRSVEVVGADVGEADVVADFTGGAIGAGVAEGQPHLAAEVEHGREGGKIPLPHAHLRGTAQLGADVELPLPGGQATRNPTEVQIGGLGGGIPVHGLRVHDGPGIDTEGGEAEVGDVLHAAGVKRIALPHGLVENHGDAVQRQRHQGAVGHADGLDLRRMDRSNCVDVAGLGDEDAAVRGGDDGFAARAAVGDLQDAPGLQFDHPDGGLVRRVGYPVDHRALAQIGRCQQQAVEFKAWGTEGDAVDEAGQAVFEFGAAEGAT